MHLSPIKHQGGISLIEVMVSITIGLFILVGVVQLYATSVANAATVSGASLIQENVRYIFSRLETDISQAGVTGCFSLANSQGRVQSVVSVGNSAGELFDFSRFVDGENDQDLNGLKFDKLTLRYFSAGNGQDLLGSSAQSFSIEDASQFKAGGVALVGDCSRAAIFRISEIDGNTLKHTSATALDVGKLVTKSNFESAYPGSALHEIYGGKSGAFRYEVEDSAAAKAAGLQCSAATPQYCALVRYSGYSLADAPVSEELIEGLEELEFEYGWQNHDDGRLFFGDAAAVESSGVWGLVDRVKVTVSLNSVSRVPTVDGSGFLDRTYSRTFMVYNQFPPDTQTIEMPATEPSGT